MSLCLAGESHVQRCGADLAMIAFLGAVSVTVSGPTDVACIVEPDPETPTAEAASGRRFLRLARVRARSHKPFKIVLAIKQLYNICMWNREGYVRLIFTLYHQESEREGAWSPLFRDARLALVPYLSEKLVPFLPV